MLQNIFFQTRQVHFFINDIDKYNIFSSITFYVNRLNLFILSLNKWIY